MLKDAIERAGSVNGDKVVEELEKTDRKGAMGFSLTFGISGASRPTFPSELSNSDVTAEDFWGHLNLN